MHMMEPRAWEWDRQADDSVDSCAERSIIAKRQRTCDGKGVTEK